MPLPPVVLNPPFNITRLSHVVLSVTDLAAARAFYVDTLGLQVSYEERHVLYLRALEERGHHSLVLKSAAASRAQVLGFKVFEAGDLDRLAAFAAARDLPCDVVEAPFQRRTLRLRDTEGVPIEFYHEMTRLAPVHQDYARYRGAKPLRIDHVNCFSSDVEAQVRLYHQLGFRTTEYTATDADEIWAAWLHRKGGVHDIAFTNGAGPRLHHVAFWVSTPLNIIDLLDLMSTTGYLPNIERGPGRHGISNAFFLYVRDPDGNRVEIYCSDYQTLDHDHEPIRWDLRDPRRQTLWGAPAPRSWFEEGTLFEGVEPTPPRLSAQPIVAP